MLSTPLEDMPHQSKDDRLRAGWRGSHRSRSPRRDRRHHHDGEHGTKRRRSRSPDRHHRHHRSRRDSQDREAKKSSSTPKPLPYQREQLHKGDLHRYEALFAEYLDIQKQLHFADLSAEESKGRWKSFMGKWNRGELAEGWYDPDQQRKIELRYLEQPQSGTRSRKDDSLDQADARRTEEEGDPKPQEYDRETQDDDDDGDGDDDGYGPAPPPVAARAFGAPVPTFQDLRHRRELVEEDRENQRADARYDRKQERKIQKERLEELAPRAEAGTRERQLEKRREVAASNRAFADAKGGAGGVEEVNDSDLLGGGDDLDSFKARKQAAQRQKNEREIRREEILRAREAEREERLAGHRQKEEQTMDMLRALAKQRFG